MANNLTGEVWEIDTAGVICTHHFRIGYLTWTPVSAGDLLIFNNADGNEVFRAQCSPTEAGETLHFKLDDWWHGLTVAQIDSGVAEVHYR